MCGRFVITSSPDDIRGYLGYAEQPDFPPRYNVAPTQPVPIVWQEHGRRHFMLARWGLVPSWVKNPKEFSLLINARLEGIIDKPSFQAAMKRRRCLVPADGFYEWRRLRTSRSPYFVRPRTGGPIAFAGLWETWVDRDGGEIDTMAIVTCRANRTLAAIHERMPVIVSPEHFDAWLDCDSVNARTAAALVGPAPDDLMEAYEITARVNKVANEGPENIARSDLGL